MNNIESRSSLSNSFLNLEGLESKRDIFSIKKNSREKINEIEKKTKGDVKVDINKKVKDFSKIKRMLDNRPMPESNQKIQDIKEKINNKTYHIDEEAIADRILRFEF